MECDMEKGGALPFSKPDNHHGLLANRTKSAKLEQCRLLNQMQK